MIFTDTKEKMLNIFRSRNPIYIHGIAAHNEHRFKRQTAVSIPYNYFIKITYTSSSIIFWMSVVCNIFSLNIPLIYILQL